MHNGVADSDATVAPDPDLEAFARGGAGSGLIAVLRPQKAVHVFVEAAPRILAAVPHARLAVIGNGEGSRASARLARTLELPADRFGFFPFRAPSARAARARRVRASLGLGGAADLAARGARGGRSPDRHRRRRRAEAVADGETGLLCPPGDPRALAGAVVALLTDPRRRAAMSEASRKRHAAHFRAEDMVRRTAAVYDDVALPT